MQQRRALWALRRGLRGCLRRGDFDNGHMNITTVGTKRFRVLELDTRSSSLRRHGAAAAFHQRQHKGG